jgi:methylamine---corrinoid protein Co-methyltransferase
VAAHLNAFVMTQATWHLDGPIHVRWGITTAREPLAVAGHCARAVESHTDLLLGNQYYTIAGPGTLMCLLETAAQSITDTASGREVLSGVASAKGVATNKTTGLEARFMGEVSHAVAGMPTDRVNEILDSLVARYEKDYKTAPAGKPFNELYDTTRVVPNDEYLGIYDEAVQILKEVGVNYRYW